MPSQPLKPVPPPALTAAESRTLRCVAGWMIPPSAAHGVPGADDDAIFADIAASLDRDFDSVRQSIRQLDALAGGAFADRTADERQAIVQQFRDRYPALAAVLVAVVVRCYYRDDRVMRSLRMELRPPFPLGFEVENGDWSLLDPVRARGKIYRDA
ncbi:MAG: hypothetical protein IT513_02330 [Burkholderiales bacterium]|nr:hypothetical protein [Burkholderiales bacterium]